MGGSEKPRFPDQTLREMGGKYRGGEKALPKKQRRHAHPPSPVQCGPGPGPSEMAPAQGSVS